MTSILLLSGGIDSAALAAWRRPEVCLFVDYGQRPAAAEARASQRITDALGLRWFSIEADCSAVGDGLLAGRPPRSDAPAAEWWPFRNQLLGTLGAAWAVGTGASEVMFGSVAGDGDRFRDGTPWFFAALDALVAGQEGGVRVSAPALGMSTEELVRVSGIDRSTIGWSFSCHVTPIGCGDCPGCLKRTHIFASLG